MGGENMTLVLGTGRVTQAAQVVSCMPPRGKADEGSGSGPDLERLLRLSQSLFVNIEPDIFQFPQWFP